jgi:tRNA threonylcarbamoyladenosine biosynthesis protein TsaB
MKILAIESSTIACSAAVADENKLYGEFFTDFKLKHSEKLLVLCDSLLKNLRMDIKEMDYFAVSCGPGSFTGLRIGMATAKGFAQALNKPIVCVSTLRALAFNAVSFGGLICPMLDAQRDQLYSAAYTSDGKTLYTHSEEGVYEFDKIFDIISNRDTKTILLGDGAEKFSDKFKGRLMPEIIKANMNILMPKASNVAYLAIEKINNGETENCFSASPNYIRTAQAEENLNKRQ